PIIETHYRKSAVRGFAKRMRMSPTAGERRLEKILLGLNDGILKGRFTTQHVVSGDWIVDFYFPEIRLAVEVDGSFHSTVRQKQRDRDKDRYCDSIDITVLRLKNSVVFGDREELIRKLRSGWRQAVARRNKVIGLPH
ncbi:DUF559 domain-containing protein, partial [Herbaspirillum sp. HC18]